MMASDNRLRRLVARIKNVSFSDNPYMHVISPPGIGSGGQDRDAERVS
jgi:hypothetical protein